MSEDTEMDEESNQRRISPNSFFDQIAEVRETANRALEFSEDNLKVIEETKTSLEGIKFAIEDLKQQIADFDIDSRIEWEAYLIYENRAISKLILDENGASNDLKKAEEFRQLKAYNESVGLLPKSSEDYYKLALRKISYNPNRLNIKTSLWHLNKAIQSDPQNVKAFVARANLNRDIDNFQDALNDYSSAISIDPEYLDAYTERGKTYRITKSFQEAIEDFEKVLEIDPNHYISILNLANLYEYKEKFVKAILAVSLHLHHSLDKTYSIFILFFSKNSPIFFACFLP